MSASTDALKAAVDALAVAVQALIAIPHEDTAAIQAQVDAINALKGQVEAATGGATPPSP